jgi:hypothetical protein
MPDEFQAEVAFGSEVLPGGIVAKVLQRAGVASRERREGKADTRRLG